MAKAPSSIAAIVTGHSRGLGAAIASQLLLRGVRVLGIARHRNPDLAKRHATALTETSLDLADSAALTQWLATDALARFVQSSTMALLVNNAGVLQPIGPLETHDIVEVARAAAVNVAAVLMLSAAFAEATRRIADRRILHISSGAASTAYAGWSVYCASKAALDQHARAVALDHSPALRIAAVAPGVVDTQMQTEILDASEDQFPDRQRFIEMKRDGRMRHPDEAGQTVADFLLSDTFGNEPVVDLRAYYVNR